MDGSKKSYKFRDKIVKTTEPFEIYKLDCKDMISSTDAFNLRTALLTMKFKKKSCDLYSFSQSPDFNLIPRIQKPREVQHFLELLKGIKGNISSYLGKKFNKTISVSCSKYDNGDYLLCHDDCVDDRSVAFIYYLNYDWLNEWGGTLDVYSVDNNFNAKEKVNSINPEFNTMIFFPVGKQSYHQVAENISNFSRLSINGWFHCEDKNWGSHKQNIELPSPIYLPIKLSSGKSKGFTGISIQPIFDDPLYKEAIQETFIKDGYIMCEEFFTSNMINMVSDEVFSNDLEWKEKGPLNKRHYKYVELDKLPLRLMFIVNFLKTDHMFKFFNDCTGLDLSGVSIEVQRWHGGHYMVSGGNDGLDRLNVLSVYLFFSRCFGSMSESVKDDVHYVFEERDTLAAKFACKPQHNTIFMVNRKSDMESHVKYCKKVDGHAWTVIVANYLVKKSLDCHVRLKKLENILNIN